MVQSLSPIKGWFFPHCFPPPWALCVCNAVFTTGQSILSCP